MYCHKPLIAVPIVLIAPLTAFADISLKNGSDLNMNGSAGSVIKFSDGSVQNTAASNSVPDGHGGVNSTVSGTNAFVGGGINNTASANYAGVSSGFGNTAQGQTSVIGGGYNNIVDGLTSTIGGGNTNLVTDQGGTIGGGRENQAGDNFGNKNDATFATVAGGTRGIATAYAASVGGGYYNEASGAGATVPGGMFNVAAGGYSFAAGRAARAFHNGAIVLADHQNVYLDSTAADQFTVRASGGVRFFTNAGHSAGAVMVSGSGSWNNLSARASKENFKALDPVDVLEKVAALSIEEWNYKAQDDSIRHIGPTAEDFWEAFNVGDLEGRITSTDADGVALAAIQGLNEKLTQEISKKEARIDALEERLASMENMIAKLQQ